MTETAPPQEKPDPAVSRGVVIVVWGGGLFLGALVLILAGEQPSIACDPEKMTPFWIAYWIGAAGSVLAGLGFSASGTSGWSASRRRFVAAVGAVSITLVVVPIGLIFGWNLRTRVAFLGIGAALLVAGLAIPRGRRWRLQSALRSAWLRILLSVVFRISVAVAVLGWILILLLAPSLPTALERSRSVRTMAEMRSMMSALETYAETNKTYPATQNMAELARLLEPSYILVLPRNDGWGRPLEYYRVTLPSGVQGFVIRSAGCDGVFEQKDPTAYTDEFFRGMNRDIVCSTVSKSQVPEGLMGF